MKFFLDTGNIEEIRRVNRLGLVDGVTTNPTLIAKEKRPFKEVIQEICREVSGPVSAEVVGLTTEEMLKEAREIATWAPNIVVKIPMTEAGLEAVNTLSKEGIKTNVTLIFSAAQGLMACKAGATYISPFVGRIDNYGFKTEIIVASVRNIAHVQQAAVLGADIATIPGSLFPSLWKHPLTDIGIARFLEDWKKVPQ